MHSIFKSGGKVILNQMSEAPVIELTVPVKIFLMNMIFSVLK